MSETVKLSDAEFTRLAATAVMGWTPQSTYVLENPWETPSGLRETYDWSPLTDWSAAGEIVAKMRADGWRIVIDEGYYYLKTPLDLAYSVKFWKVGMSEKRRPSCAEFPRAITIAALLAVGAITEEQV